MMIKKPSTNEGNKVFTTCWISPPKVAKEPRVMQPTSNASWLLVQSNGRRMGKKSSSPEPPKGMGCECSQPKRCVEELEG